MKKQIEQLSFRAD